MRVVRVCVSLGVVLSSRLWTQWTDYKDTVTRDQKVIVTVKCRANKYDSIEMEYLAELEFLLELKWNRETCEWKGMRSEDYYWVMQSRGKDCDIIMCEELINMN